MFIKIFFIFLLGINASFAKTIITSLPEFAWAVEQLTTDAKVISLLEGSEDPHFVDASPGFIFKVAKADIVISNGMQLEIGWLPKIISLSGNSKVQMDTKGYCDASVGVTKIGVMKNVDRSMGDVHPDGNPHYTLSIPRMIESMDTIKNCLLKNGFNQNKIELNFQKIKAKMNKALKGFKYKFSGNKYYVFHREFNYLGNDLKMTFMESLEKVPGVLPSASYLTQLAVKSKKDKPLKVLAGSSSSRKILEKFKEFSNIDYTQLDLHPKRDEDYLDFIEKLIRKISVK